MKFVVEGLLAFGESQGFWITHSIPRFPFSDRYEYPSNGHAYGQMGICISLAITALPDLGNS